MTDKTAIDCAEALIQFCDDRDCVCDGCVFRKNKHDGSGEWGCNIGEIVFLDVYDANEVWENYKSEIRHRGAKMDTDEEVRKRGGGDPSPEDIRPISGGIGMKVSHSGADTSDPEVIPVSWQTEVGTDYAGVLNVTTGVLTLKNDKDEETRKRGVWLDIGGVYKCSVCGCIEEWEYDYCRNCGAKMSKEE
jgi:hypothetical protein